MNPLTSISPIDGRYIEKTKKYSDYFSELALIQYRIKTEIEWLIFYGKEIEKKPFSEEETQKLRDIYFLFHLEDGEKVKKIEKTTNHDVKAVEYYLREKLEEIGLDDKLEWIHIFCTSEDINNLAYNLMLQDAHRNLYFPLLEKIYWQLYEKGLAYAEESMMAKTHGQPASPTTMGKEWINYCARLKPLLKKLNSFTFTGKFNGATGNYNAHYFSIPDKNWIQISADFIQSLNLEPNLWTTQIEPHDTWGRYFSLINSINQIFIDFSKDIWLYISMDYFTQKRKEGEVGSSTMPHKVNPIDFENGEGNMEIANSLASFFTKKLTNSRLQRDLSDSTVERNMGLTMAYSAIAYHSLLKGMEKLELNKNKLLEDLNNNYQVLAEAIQSVLRLKNYPDPYDLLKKATRGKKITKDNYSEMVDTLPITQDLKDSFHQLTPEKYIGLAKDLVHHFHPKY